MSRREMNGLPPPPAPSRAFFLATVARMGRALLLEIKRLTENAGHVGAVIGQRPANKKGGNPKAPALDASVSVAAYEVATVIVV
jgi:hypothetical protein